MFKLSKKEEGYIEGFIEGFIGQKDLRIPPTIETPVEGKKDRLKSVSIVGVFEGGMRRENQAIAEDMDADESEKSNSNTCTHPKKERSYIGNNLLRCDLCGAEFS